MHNKLFNEIADQFGSLTGLAGAEEAELLIEVFKEMYIDNQCRGAGLWHSLCDHYGKLRKITLLDRNTFTERLIRFVTDIPKTSGNGSDSTTPQTPQHRIDTFYFQ